MVKRRRKGWSYNAGKRGLSWVRAFEHHRDGSLYVEWRETELVTDPESGEVTAVEHRRRRKLEPEDQTRTRAVLKAEELAASFAELEAANPEAPLTLNRLMNDYILEVTPRKGEGKRGHDARARRVWRAYFDGQVDERRRTGRHPSTLDRIDWDGFIAARRGGEIAGWAAVEDRQVQYDLKFLIAVLNWATGAKPEGSDRTYIASSPWSAEIRRAQRWTMPRKKTPHRPAMRDDIRTALTTHGPSWQFGLALVLERDTRRRNSSIRRLDWSEINQQDWTIRWRGELDKDGRDTVTPLLEDATKEALRRAPSRGIAGPVFPSGADASKPTPRHTFQTWLRRAKKRLLEATPEEQRPQLAEQLRGVGFHAEKRAGVRDPRFRSLPPLVQQTIAGTRYETLRDVYDEVGTDEVRDAWKAARTAATGSN